MGTKDIRRRQLDKLSGQSHHHHSSIAELCFSSFTPYGKMTIKPLNSTQVNGEKCEIIETPIREKIVKEKRKTKGAPKFDGSHERVSHDGFMAHLKPTTMSYPSLLLD